MIELVIYLFFQVSNSSYKMVSDDPTAGLVSPNQFGGRPGNLITLMKITFF
jgi:hypothetical protein